ncbi:MAG TPA: hypothetical protein PLC98_16660 [Anaerolineales bacterium]|nr:hypothetical protein [Anaerolineales bacterium]
MRRRLFSLVASAVLCASLALWASPARAQDGVAIASPESGQGVSGVVEIRGTAVRQPFLRYELAFAYDPNPRGTWFAIGEPGTAPVVDGLLGVWDTTGLADGVYALRLRVYAGERDFAEFFVGRVVVRRDLPTQSPPAEAPTSAPTAGVGGDTGPTPTAIALPPPATALAPAAEAPGGLATSLTILNGERLRTAFGDGIRFSAIAFTIMAAYAVARWIWRRRRTK